MYPVMLLQSDQNTAMLRSFLVNPASTPGSGDVRIHETHASIVALHGEYAYKVKKAVNFGFLNFSSLQQRLRFCIEEVILNRRLCSPLYLGILPIYQTGDHYSFGEAFLPESMPEFFSGPSPVDFAVWMVRAEERYFLKNILKERSLQEKELDRIISTLERFYHESASDDLINRWGDLNHIQISIEENFQQLASYANSILDRNFLQILKHYSYRFFAIHNEAYFATRIKEKRIRDCHGDLHLDHIILKENSVCIYDCIEFNERFRYIDIVNDYAFLCMDLVFNGFSPLAEEIEYRLRKATGDENSHSLFDFYFIYRALVRCKVHCMTATSSDIQEEDREANTYTARQYLALAVQRAVCGHKPMVICLTGLTGSGKSALARRLSELLEWPRLLSDEIRKEIAQRPLHERTPPELRGWLYSEEMSEKTYARLFQDATTLLTRSRGVILDAMFGSQNNRNKLLEFCDRNGSDYMVIETVAPEELIKERLQKRSSHTDEVSDARLEDLDLLKSKYIAPDEVDRNHLLVIPTTGEHIDTLKSAVIQLIDRRLANVAS